MDISTELPPRYWMYVQRSGNMFLVSNGVPVLVTSGYSGNGTCENNPADQFVRLHGPLPQGWYTIGPDITFKNMVCCMELAPDAANVMQGRGGFLIHGGAFAGPHGMTSEGCICLPMDGRNHINQSGARRLQVVGEKPAEMAGVTLDHAQAIPGSMMK